MAGLSGISLPIGLASHFGPLAGELAKYGIGFDLGGGTNFVLTYLWVIGLALVAFLLPNSQELLARHDPSLASHASSGPGTPARRLRGWTPTRTWALVMGVMLAVGLLTLARVTEFLYFQF
jgi:hypothetical protein